MKRDKLKLYVLEIVLLIILFLAFFVSNIFNKKLLALLLTVLAVVTKLLIKKKKPVSFYKKQVCILMAGFSVKYLIVFYLMGIYFGYYKSPTPFGTYTIINFIIPYTVIIISSEIMRRTLIVQDAKYSRLLITLSMILIDMIIYAGVYNLSTLNEVLVVVGFVLFASIACNLLYNYISNRFGYESVVVYRMLTILYVYFLPYVPDVYIFFRSFLRMLYPYVIYLTLEYTYSKGNLVSAYKDRKKNIISTTILAVTMSLMIALISCNFRYGIIVIGSGSMTGTIDMGDAVIFETYHNGAVRKNDVIIFNNENIKTVHRVVDIKNVNGEYRYFTKGDANSDVDDGYVLKENVIGKVKFKIKYIGYPTLWVRDLFEK